MAKENTLKAFRASERQGPLREKQPRVADKDQVDWRHFPILEQLLESEEFQPIFEKCEATCRKLDRLMTTGEGHDEVRARKAMAAYGRALDLIAEIIDYKDTFSENPESS